VWSKVFTRGNWMLVLGSALGVYEVVWGGGRPFVLGFAAALLGLKFTLPSGKE
jgi:hypothetical protein